MILTAPDVILLKKGDKKQTDGHTDWTGVRSAFPLGASCAAWSLHLMKGAKPSLLSAAGVINQLLNFSKASILALCSSLRLFNEARRWKTETTASEFLPEFHYICVNTYIYICAYINICIQTENVPDSQGFDMSNKLNVPLSRRCIMKLVLLTSSLRTGETNNEVCWALVESSQVPQS